MEENPTVWRKIDLQSCPKVMYLLSRKVDAVTFRYKYAIIRTLKKVSSCKC